MLDIGYRRWEVQVWHFGFLVRYVGETLDQPPPIVHFSRLRGYLKLPETSLIVIPAKAHWSQHKVYCHEEHEGHEEHEEVIERNV